MPITNAGLVMETFRGGQNDQDPPNILEEDQVVLAENVEFFNSTLGERRAGCEAIDLTGSALDDESHVCFLGVHTPELEEPQDAQLWAVSTTPEVSTSMAYFDGGDWQAVTPVDAPWASAPQVFEMQGASVHNKFFLAYASDQDRLHVWDGETMRRTGLAAPTAAPSAADEGSGTFSGDRTYRIRVIQATNTANGLKILRRSEPGPEVVFTPSGSGEGVTVTADPITFPNEGETHWELEASDGDGNFYVIATTVVATTTVVDTTNPGTGYGANPDFTLSDPIGEYALQPSCRYLVVDQDRLIMGGSWTNPELGSRISWSPVWGSGGPGTDERLPTDFDSYIDLDWMQSGGLTGLSDPLNGSFYAFKWSHIYKVQRTGQADQAYQAFLLSSAHGAVPGSIVSGMDEFGRGCVYFLDPAVGPMRVGSAGIQYLRNIRTTWRTVNINAKYVTCHGVYYTAKQQLHWWIATHGADAPNKKLILQVNEVESQGEVAKRGWSVASGRIAEGYCSTVYPDLVQNAETGSLFLIALPYIGLPMADGICRCDTGETDNGTSYVAKVISRPYIVAGLLNRWGGMTGALLGAGIRDRAKVMKVSMIRDFGIEQFDTFTDFMPVAEEDTVIKVLDNLHMSDARAIQVEFSDE